MSTMGCCATFMVDVSSLHLVYMLHGKTSLAAMIAEDQDTSVHILESNAKEDDSNRYCGTQGQGSA